MCSAVSKPEVTFVHKENGICELWVEDRDNNQAVEISDLVTDFFLSKESGEPLAVELELAPVYVRAASHPEQVTVGMRTYDLLKKLGWTPPTAPKLRG